MKGYTPPPKSFPAHSLAARYDQRRKRARGAAPARREFQAGGRQRAFFLDLQHFDDDDEGNARIARIIDYLILVDGDLQHIARALDDSVLQIERRKSRAESGA